MTTSEPTTGVWTVACASCGATAYTSDTTPPADPHIELRRLADTACPRNGVDCPNTVAAVTEREDRHPAHLKQLLHAVRDEIRDQRARKRRIQLSALTASTPNEIVVEWGTPLPDATYCVAATLVTGPEHAGHISVTIKPGSITPTGCRLIVTVTEDVAEGMAGLHVTATP